MTASLASAELLSRLRTELPSDAITVAEDDLQTYGRDWTKVYEPAPLAIVFPRTTAEVAAIMAAAYALGVAVVPSGGRTGLAAGAVAANGELVLSLARMTRVDAVDPRARTLRVQAGAVTEAVHQHCAPLGLTWPVDFASKGSSQVGGNIATNAGGVRVIRYGLTRQWVLGLQVVTPQGEILELNGALEKNNTGLDLRQLFIGSEGTLGIITEATLKLAPMPGAAEVFFFGVDDVPAVLALFDEVRRQPFTVQAFEFMGANCLEAVKKNLGVTNPLTEATPYTVLLEIERPEAADGQAKLEEWLGSLFERALVRDGTQAQSPQQARTFWTLREGISESLSRLGQLHKHDIALPIRELEAFTTDFLREFAQTYRSFEVFLFGHIGDGNLHVNILKPDAMPKPEFLATCATIDHELFGRVQAHHGSISAEHGIGLLKKKSLGFTRSAAEMVILRAVKRALDPRGLLNPGKIFD